LAEFLVEDQPAPNPEDRRAALHDAILMRFPGITPDELLRGHQIATELLRADTIELNAEIAKLKAELRRRRLTTG